MAARIVARVRPSLGLCTPGAPLRWASVLPVGKAASLAAPVDAGHSGVAADHDGAVVGGCAGHPAPLGRTLSYFPTASSQTSSLVTPRFRDISSWPSMATSPPAAGTTRMATAAATAATAATSPRHLHATPSPRGIFSSVGDTYQKMKLDKEVAQASEAFALTLQSLVDLGRPMDADAYLDIVRAGKAAAGLDGWRASLPWVASSAAVAEVTEVEKMIGAMTPAERRQVRLLGGAATRRVAESSGVEADKVEGLVKNVQTMGVLQKWLRKRKASGRTLPKSRKELMVMMAAPGSGATMHMHAQRGS